jgi:hypothetical protein
VASAIVFVIKIRFSVIVNGIIIPVKNTTEIRLIIKIFAYSAMKIIANIALLYSILNPETNSDSPSAKSNGVRFVSARLVINQVINKGIIITMFHDMELMVIVDISSCLYRISALSKIIDIVTSYEIVWATPRRAPKSEYLEFEDHPAINVQYTFILETHRKYSAPKVKKSAGL